MWVGPCNFIRVLKTSTTHLSKNGPGIIYKIIKKEEHKIFSEITFISIDFTIIKLHLAVCIQIDGR